MSQMHGAAVAAAMQLEAVRGNLTQQVGVLSVMDSGFWQAGCVGTGETVSGVQGVQGNLYTATCGGGAASGRRDVWGNLTQQRVVEERCQAGRVYGRWGGGVIRRSRCGGERCQVGGCVGMGLQGNLTHSRRARVAWATLPSESIMPVVLTVGMGASGHAMAS